MASASNHETATVETDDGGFGRYRNGHHQRQLQQRLSKNPPLQHQRSSFADPMSDGTLRGFTNPDYDNITENCSEQQQQQQQQSRPHDLPVFTVSGAKVAFHSPAPGGESSTDWPADAWQQGGQRRQGPMASCGRTRLLVGALIVILLAATIVLVIALPVTLVANRRGAGPAAAAARKEATGELREITCGLLTASSASGSSVYRFRGVPYALPPNGTHLMSWARPIDSQLACAMAWSLTPEEAAASWFNRRLRYPYPTAADIPMCSQYQGMGASADSTAVLQGSPDCLYLDVATPAAEPGRDLPTVVVLASLVGIHTPASLLLDVPDDLVTSTSSVYFSVRHRLGPLAYFTHPDLSDESPRRVAGNMPLSDLVAALRWLHVNARSFGGSPNNVVLLGFGTSGSLALNMALTGEYGNLFHKLWISSPPVSIQQNLAAAERMDSKLITCLKASCRGALDVKSFIASVDWSRLNSGLQTDFFDIPALAPAGSGLLVGGSRRGFSVIDGIRVPDSLINLAARKALTKPLVLGETPMLYHDRI